MKYICICSLILNLFTVILCQYIDTDVIIYTNPSPSPYWEELDKYSQKTLNQNLSSEEYTVSIDKVKELSQKNSKWHQDQINKASKIYSDSSHIADMLFGNLKQNKFAYALIFSLWLVGFYLIVRYNSEKISWRTMFLVVFVPQIVSLFVGLITFFSFTMTLILFFILLRLPYYI